MQEHWRIKFYSEYDLSFAFHMKRAELFFQNWEQNIGKLDINTILELYNIRKYFCIDKIADMWAEGQFQEYKKKADQIPGIIGRFCTSVPDADWLSIHKTVDTIYIEDFWGIIDDYKVYEKMSPSTLESILNSDAGCVWPLLRYRRLSEHYSAVLTNHLLNNRQTAPKLISYFLEAKRGRDKPLYFPKELTAELCIKLISDYVDSKNPHINSVRLIENAMPSKILPISDRLKKKARDKGKELQDKHLENSIVLSYGAQVAFKSIPNGSKEEFFDKSKKSAYCTYSKEWVDENKDFPTLLNNFIYLFEYVDRCFRSNFVSLESELTLTEKHMYTRGKNDYNAGFTFNFKDHLSSLQMYAYLQELSRRNIRLEDIFNWFFETYLHEEFSAEGFRYTPPSIETIYYEKCKLLSSAIDGVLKQYHLFCEDGYVDRELLEMSSHPLAFREINSTVSNKYAYANSQDIGTEMFLLFDDQSSLHFTKEASNSNYESLQQLLASENLRIDDFAEFQQGDLNWLIKQGSIFVDKSGYLQTNKSRVFVLKDLFLHEVICPMYYDDDLRQQVSDLAASGDLRYESTLFSVPEQKYLNFVLNNAEFGNSLGIRNRYIHDTCPLDEDTELSHYCELLKIMVLIIIKINAEFCAPNRKSTVQ